MVLDNLQGSVCHKTQPPSLFWWRGFYLPVGKQPASSKSPIESVMQFQRN